MYVWMGVEYDIEFQYVCKWNKFLILKVWVIDISLIKFIYFKIYKTIRHIFLVIMTLILKIYIHVVVN